MAIPADLKDLLDKAAQSGELPEADRPAAEEAAEGSGKVAVPDEMLKDTEEATAPGAEEEIEGDLRNTISTMTVPQRTKLALFGNAACRALLIRDPTRMIQMLVLRNPKLGMREVDEYARNPNLSEWVLRTIAANQTWIKSYSVKANLVFNPKTPLDLSLKWVRYLNATDLKKLSRSKNIAQVLSTTAKKYVDQKD